MAIPAHPSADRPRSAAEPARHSGRAPESNSGKGCRSEPAGSIDVGQIRCQVVRGSGVQAGRTLNARTSGPPL